ncbi:hypothetical protein [Crateriforma conspicua]|uniref:hypothetical protein n=1 Tax=Crateriforma conspicua TaxID=2527996 RepID=UPI0011B35F21|nr:hypothetical protein [Crateriforma conspicua]
MKQAAISDLFRSFADAGRFVILYHDVGPNLSRTNRSHFDWMFAGIGGLVTFAVVPEQWEQALAETGEIPETGVGSHHDVVRRDHWMRGVPEKPLTITATRLPDHRTKYLEYEGPISGNRGSVRRVDSGFFRQRPDRACLDIAFDECPAKRMNHALAPEPVYCHRLSFSPLAPCPPPRSMGATDQRICDLDFSEGINNAWRLELGSG